MGIPTLVRDIPVYEGWLMHGENVYKADSVTSFEYYMERLLRKTLPDVSREGRLVAGKRSFRLIGERLRDIYQAEGLLCTGPHIEISRATFSAIELAGEKIYQMLLEFNGIYDILSTEDKQ